MTPPLDGRGEGQTNLERVEIRDSTGQHTEKDRQQAGQAQTSHITRQPEQGSGTAETRLLERESPSITAMELLKPSPLTQHRPTGGHLMMRRQHHRPGSSSRPPNCPSPSCRRQLQPHYSSPPACLRSLLWPPVGLLPASLSSVPLRADSTVPPRWRRPTSRRAPSVTLSSTYGPLDN